MNLPPARYDHCLITGASSGIGRAFAEALAPRAARLTLSARRQERLLELATALEQAHVVRCRVAVADLSSPDGAERLTALLRESGAPPIDLLVNNAGFGRHCGWGARDWDDWRRMFQVNMIAASELLHRLWPDLTAVPGRGAINVASTAGFQPMPWFAAYAATKAFLRSLSSGVALEARRRGARILSLCPGPTRTEFGRVAGSRWDSGPLGMSAERVVRVAVSAYERGKIEVVPGLLNKLMAVLASRAPRGIVVVSAGWLGDERGAALSRDSGASR